MIIDESILQRVARERRFDDRTMEIARRLFLGKESPQKLAKEFALVDKRIYAIRTEVTRQIQRYALPPGWSEVTLRGPADVVRATQISFHRQLSARRSSSMSGNSTEGSADPFQQRR